MSEFAGDSELDALLDWLSTTDVPAPRFKDDLYARCVDAFADLDRTRGMLDAAVLVRQLLRRISERDSAPLRIDLRRHADHLADLRAWQSVGVSAVAFDTGLHLRALDW